MSRRLERHGMRRVSISRCLRHADRERRAEASECVHIQVLDADGGGIAPDRRDERRRREGVFVRVRRRREDRFLL